MGKIIFIVAFLALGVFLIVQAFKYGKATATEEKKPEKPTTDLDKKIKDLQEEIDRVEQNTPAEIEDNTKKLAELNSKLDRAKRLKEKFENQ